MFQWQAYYEEPPQLRANSTSHCGVVKKHAPIFAIPLEGIQSEGDDFTMKEGIIKLLLAFGGLSIPRRLVKNPNS